MNNKTFSALLKLLNLDLVCVCGKKLIIRKAIDCYGHYLLLEAKEENHIDDDFGYVICNIKSKIVVESYTACTLEQTMTGWEKFKKELHEQKIL